MPDITIPSFVVTGLQVIIAFTGAFFVALWLSLIVWTFRDARRRSRDIFAILLATLMVAIFGPLGLLLYFLLRPPVTLDELYERSLEEEALLQDLEERPRCPGCSRQVKEEWILCPDCHTTLKNVCDNCQNGLNLNWSICPYCGTPVEAEAEQQHQHPGSPGQAQLATQQMQAPPPYAARPATMPSEPSAPTVSQPPIATPPTTRSEETRPHLPEAGAA
jgi:RNA polymerase subunit RPABC4/transcription elongation factor Spt4